MPTQEQRRQARTRQRHAFAELARMRNSGDFNMLTDSHGIAEQLVWDEWAVDTDEALRFLALWREGSR